MGLQGHTWLFDKILEISERKEKAVKLGDHILQNPV
jgi:hypothetical protein